MRCRNVIAAGWGFLALIVAAADPVAAAPWTATQSGYWTNAATWGGGGTPGAGDDATIGAVTVTQDVSSADLSACTVNGTLVFMGTNTSLNATTIAVNGTVTHPLQSATATNPAGQWIADNRVWIVCSNLTVAPGGSINVTAKGYLGGPGTGGAGKGPGGSPYSNSRPGGAGHGGLGGRGNTVGSIPNLGGISYGSIDTPEDPGSGGASSGGAGSVGGPGGGAVRIDATGHVLVNGTIAANGGQYAGNFAASGSGGSILITSHTFGSTNGALSAAGALGGPGWGGEAEACGDGAGGRIAIHYNTTAQAVVNLTAKPSATINVGGACRYNSRRGEPGSVWVSDTSFWPPTVFTNGVRLPSSIPGLSAWMPDSLKVSNTWVIVDPSLTVSVTNNVVVQGANGRLDIGDGATAPMSFSCGGQLLVTNTALLYLLPGLTNGAMTNSLQLNVGGDLTVADGATVYPVSNPTNGGSARLVVRSLTIPVGGTINAAGIGYWGGTRNPPYPITHLAGWGPAGGACGNPPYRGGGGGHGGKGGNSQEGNAGGNPYGSSNAPVQCGSGGGANDGGNATRLGGAGGGLVWITASSLVSVDGMISANGSLGGSGGGGGAGGGIFLSCKKLQGGGVLTANGANGILFNSEWSGGGGGGRIAVAAVDIGDWSGTTMVSGGVANVTYDGAAGSLVWIRLPQPGTLITIL